MSAPCPCATSPYPSPASAGEGEGEGDRRPRFWKKRFPSGRSFFGSGAATSPGPDLLTHAGEGGGSVPSRLRSSAPGWLPPRSVLIALLALAGLVLFGQGAWIHAKASLAQILLERAFATSLATGTPVKAWSWADTWPVARIEVPRLNQSAIALAGASGEALAFGPGHLDGSPEAGERGTAIYAAHRDTHFAFLKDMKSGDEIVVSRADGASARFRVTGTRIARWDRSGLDPHAAGRNLALVTCFPFDARTRGPLRFVVEAEAIE